ncbi:MAG: hypothetical protein ACOCR1_04870 [Planctomycetota bacterium]
MRALFNNIMQHPVLSMLFGVFIGLAIGLAIGLVKAFKMRVEYRSRERKLNEEIANLREHIHRQMEINARGNSSLEEELEDLRQKNENLRVTVKTLENKPGRAEIKQLKIYDRAVRLMNERAPGFSGAWEKALRDAEEMVEGSETGMRAFVRRVADKIPLVSGEPPQRPSLHSGDAEETDSDSGDDHSESTG